MSSTRQSDWQLLTANRTVTGSSNQATDYGVIIQTADAPSGALYWKIISVRHLSPAENCGRHNLYLDVIDEAGQRVRNPDLRVAYTWEGRRDQEAALPTPLDKPANEPAGNLDLYQGQIITAWLQGDDLPSDRVVGVHTAHPDEPAEQGNQGNMRFHHSFHVLFQRTVQDVVQAGPDGTTNGNQPPAPPPTPVPATPPTPPSVLTAEQWIGMVTATQLNVRLGPGTEHAQIATLFQGDPVTVTGRVGEWLQVVVNWQQGYVHSAYVQPQGTQTSLTPSTTQAGIYAPPAEQLFVNAASVDTIAGAVATTWNRYGSLLLSHAAQLGIDPSVAVAVLVAESKGQPFGTDGRLIIRFENHIFYHYWGKANEARFRQHFTFDGTTTWQGHQWRADANSGWLPCHANQAVEWQVFDFARQLDERAALYAISMGAPQIMGFNHTAVGYPTAQAMFQAFQADVRHQIASLFQFMTNNGLVDAMRRGDYQTFAQIYNGPGQADYYATLIRQNIAAFATARGATASRGLPPAAQATSRLPMPPSPLPSKPLSEADPALYAAWRTHMIQGFENNQTLFRRTLNGFMHPYWITVGMYGMLFVVGIVAFVVAMILALRPVAAGGGLGPTAVFGSLSVVAFLTFFLSRPLQALEENLQFITWLGIVYNTYWTRLLYIQDLDSVQQELSAASTDALTQLNTLIDKHAARSQARPNLPDIASG